MNVCVYIIIVCMCVYIYIIYILSSHNQYMRVRLGSATVTQGLKENFCGPSGLGMRMKGVQQRFSLFQERPLDGQHQPLKELAKKKKIKKINHHL